MKFILMVFSILLACLLMAPAINCIPTIPTAPPTPPTRTTNSPAPSGPGGPGGPGSVETTLGTVAVQTVTSLYGTTAAAKGRNYDLEQVF